MSTQPPAVAPNAMGIKYVDSISPYQTIRTADGASSWMRYLTTDARQWIHRVTVATDGDGNVTTTVEKTFGQWAGRLYHVYVGVNDEYASEYFDDMNYDAIVVSGLQAPDTDYNGTYIYTGRRMELTVAEDAYLFTEAASCKPAFFLTLESGLSGILVYNSVTLQWNLVVGIDPDDPTTWGAGIVVTGAYHRTYRNYRLERITGVSGVQVGDYVPDYTVQMHVEAGGGFVVDGLNPIFLHPKYNNATSPYKAFIIYDSSVPGSERWVLYTGAYDGVGEAAPVAVEATLLNPTLLDQATPPLDAWDTVCTLDELA